MQPLSLSFQTPALSLRPVSERDDELVREIFVQTRRDEFAPLGWPETLLLNLLHSQCTAQRSDWEARYPDSAHHVIVRERQDIGRLWTDDRPDSLHLVDIAILPAHQNQGVGTDITSSLRTLATARGVPLTLSVYKGNVGAFRLYERLGARITGEFAEGTYWSMAFPT